MPHLRGSKYQDTKTMQRSSTDKARHLEGCIGDFLVPPPQFQGVSTGLCANVRRDKRYLPNRQLRGDARDLGHCISVHSKADGVQAGGSPRGFDLEVGVRDF